MNFPTFSQQSYRLISDDAEVIDWKSCFFRPYRNYRTL